MRCIVNPSCSFSIGTHHSIYLTSAPAPIRFLGKDLSLSALRECSLAEYAIDTLRPQFAGLKNLLVGGLNDIQNTPVRGFFFLSIVASTVTRISARSYAKCVCVL
jgi:hypothetical protein